MPRTSRLAPSLNLHDDRRESGVGLAGRAGRGRAGCAGGRSHSACEKGKGRPQGVGTRALGSKSGCVALGTPPPPLLGPESQQWGEGWLIPLCFGVSARVQRGEGRRYQGRPCGQWCLN